MQQISLLWNVEQVGYIFAESKGSLQLLPLETVRGATSLDLVKWQREMLNGESMQAAGGI